MQCIKRKSQLALPAGSFQLMLVKGVTMVEIEASLAV